MIMLVPSMNSREVYNQVVSEHTKLLTTTIPRLLHEYDRERKKLSIKKENSYFKDYTIKTRGKNTWLFFFHKAPSQPRYKGMECINFLGVVYYYDKVGLRVFSIGDGSFVTGYNGHFFKRYNERLGLQLTEPLDIIKTFFKNSAYTTTDVIEKNNKLHAFGISKDGVLLGEYIQEPKGLEWKTFITRELAREKQDRMEKQMVKELQMETEGGLKIETLNACTPIVKKDIYLAIMGQGMPQGLNKSYTNI